MKGDMIRLLVVTGVLFGVNYEARAIFGFGKTHFGHRRGGWLKPKMYLKTRHFLKPSKALGLHTDPAERGRWRAEKKAVLTSVQQRAIDVLLDKVLEQKGYGTFKAWSAAKDIKDLVPEKIGPKKFYEKVEKAIRPTPLTMQDIARYEKQSWRTLLPQAGARPATGAGPTAGTGFTAGARYTAGAGSAAGARPATGAGPTAGTGFTAGARYTAGAGSATGARPAMGAEPTHIHVMPATTRMDDLTMLGEKHASIPAGLNRNTAALLVHPDKFVLKTISQKRDALQRFGVDTTGLTSDEMNIVADTIVKRILR